MIESKQKGVVTHRSSAVVMAVVVGRHKKEEEEEEEAKIKLKVKIKGGQWRRPTPLGTLKCALQFFKWFERAKR